MRWYWRTTNFATVMQRRQLKATRVARALCWVLRLGMLAQLVVGVWLLIMGIRDMHTMPGLWLCGLAVVLLYPLVWAHLIVVPLFLGRWLVIEPRQRRVIKRSAELFANHPGVRIAIAGSYGKTSMKELLHTVLGAGLKVAASPANKNVAISHARFADSLEGDEDVILIEFGEGAPGDITRFAHQTRPTHGVITGVAAAHLNTYKTLSAAALDIFSLARAVPHEHLYVNGESEAAREYIAEDMQVYNNLGALGWRVGKVNVSLQGVHFVLSKGNRRHELRSGLLGRHQVGPLAFAAALAMELGIDDNKVVEAISTTKAYEHRMQAYQLRGAWVIDDTYNGNLEGVKAGTRLLAELPATRKWYVTPGLVDQGSESADIHRQVGSLIAAAKPDIVVLMRNSAEAHIRRGLEAAGFAGEVRTQDEPLEFYRNLAHHVAGGDLVLMQNDWTDNYA